MPEIRIRQEAAHIFRGNKFAEFEPVSGDRFGIIPGCGDGNAMAARAKGYAKSDERQNIPVSSEGGQDSMHVTDLGPRRCGSVPKLSALHENYGQPADRQRFSLREHFGGGAGIAVVAGEMFAPGHSRLAYNYGMAIKRL